MFKQVLSKRVKSKRAVLQLGGTSLGRASLALAVAWGGFACGAAETTVQAEQALSPEVIEEQADFYQLSHLVEVQVELSEDDWEKLRNQGRDLIAAFGGALTGGLEDYEYDYLDATVTVDGERFENVAVRKKGFLGSLSAARPSIKVHFDRQDEGRTFRGFKRLTFNNNRQDPSNSHQCLAYGMFAAAGIAAPRCNLAHVVVNGEDLGFYTNVEPIKKPMLARVFESDEGNLYEGQIADFSQDGIALFQLKTNEAENDRSDLQAVVDALQLADDQVVAALEAVLDLEQFRTFWAMETLLGHWDSYSGNANNYYIYHDPTTDKLVFLPWGTDGSFEGANPFDPFNTSATVYANGLLANRLYNLPAQRTAFRQKLEELNEMVWVQDTLQSQLDQIEQLSAPPAAAVEEQSTIISTHPEIVRSELAQEAPEWIDAVPAPVDTCSTIAEISGSFATTWGTLNTASPESGSFEMQLEVDGQPLATTWIGGAGADATTGEPRVRFSAALSDAATLIVELQTVQWGYQTGETQFHGLETVGFVSVIDGAGFRLGGFVGAGSVEFDEAGVEAGQPVSGSFSGLKLQLGCVSL